MIVYKMRVVDGVQWKINVLKEMRKDHKRSVAIFIVINNAMGDNVINIIHVQY